MINKRNSAEQRRVLTSAGLDQETTGQWLSSIEEIELPASASPQRLDADAAKARPSFDLGWDLIERLPLRSKRNPSEKNACDQIIQTLADLCWRFCRVHRDAMYHRLTDDLSKPLRVDALVWNASELWPGLVPTRSEVAKEGDRMQVDRDGREINQGMFIGQMLSGRECGTHLVLSMLRPTAEAEERLDEFIQKGVVDLGTARVEARGEAGFIFFKHLRSLNAEDFETSGPWDVAVDLILLHPEIRLGVLRGDPIEHPKYKGRRIFSSGLNLTKLYHGKIPFLFYMMRDLGPVNKMHRGLARDDYQLDEPENTLEKPWVAVVETFAIGGGCQLLLVVDYVIAESGAYFNLPARKEGIIPGCANMRLQRFLGDRLAQQAILFDKTFYVDSPEGRRLVNEVHPREKMDEAVELCVAGAAQGGMVSAGANRKALRVHAEPLDKFREYMATNAKEQAFCLFSDQLTDNLKKFWNAESRRL